LEHAQSALRELKGLESVLLFLRFGNILETTHKKAKSCKNLDALLALTDLVNCSLHHLPFETYADLSKSLTGWSTIETYSFVPA